MPLTFCIFHVHGTCSRVGQHTGLSHQFQLVFWWYLVVNQSEKEERYLKQPIQCPGFLGGTTTETPASSHLPRHQVWPYTENEECLVPCKDKNGPFVWLAFCIFFQCIVYSPFLKIHKLLAYGQGTLHWLAKRPASKSENSKIRDLWARPKNSTILHCKHNQLCLNKARATSSVYLERMCDRNASVPLSGN